MALQNRTTFYNYNLSMYFYYNNAFSYPNSTIQILRIL